MNEKISVKKVDSTDKFPFKRIEIFAISSAALAAVFFIVSIFIFTFNSSPINLSRNIDSSIWGNLGSFLSGAVGSIFSITTILLVFLTYKAQKKELEDTRAVMETQNKTQTLQQFENTFFKLLDNHSVLLKGYEDNMPILYRLKEYSDNIMRNAAAFNRALNTKLLSDYRYFSFSPLNDEYFNFEIIEKTVNDIDHISSYIRSKANFLNETEYLFYYMTLFNSLSNGEKFIYGYQAKLEIPFLYSITAAEVSNMYNDYFNEISNEYKLGQDKKNLWPPRLELSISGMEQLKRLPKELLKDSPQLIIQSLENYPIEIEEFCFGNYLELHDSKFTIQPNNAESISVFKLIDHLHFGDKYEVFSQEQNLKLFQQYFQSLSRGNKNYPISFNAKNSNGDWYKYRSSLDVSYPYSADQVLTFTLLINPQ